MGLIKANIITTSLQKRKKKNKDKKKKRIKMFKIGKEDIIKTNYNDDIIKDNKASLTSINFIFLVFCNCFLSCIFKYSIKLASR